MEEPKKSMFGTSGIRGVVNTEVTPILALRIGAALADIFRTGLLTLGRDTRTSGQMLSSAVAAGALSGGLGVVDLGVLPTPALAYLTKSLKAVSGVMVTASHNPPEFNGLKLFDREGKAYDTVLQTQIENTYQEGRCARVDWKQLKNVSSVDHNLAYRNMITSGTGLERRWDVAVDFGSGASHQIASDIFRSLRCRVVTLNAQPDGFFPGRDSEPTHESLGTLSATVRRMACDIGIAFDGDADRVSFVDESGRYIPGDVALAAFSSRLVAERKGGTVAIPIDSSLSVQEAIEMRGGKVVWTKVGDANVAEAIIRTKALFGGEPSGAWIHPNYHLCPDGILSAVLTMKAVEQTKASVHEFFSKVPTYPIKRGKISCSNNLKAKVMRDLASDLPKALGGKPKITELDGVRIQVPSGWLLVRPSGTEPAIRLTAEARSEQLVEQLFKTAHDLCIDRIREYQA